MDFLQGYLSDIAKIEEDIRSNRGLGGEELIILAYSIGTLHANILERIEPNLSKKRRYHYSRSESEKNTLCECGGKQKPKYVLENPKRFVCQRCYKMNKK